MAKNCITVDGPFFLMLWPYIGGMGRITSDVVRGMSVTQFIWVGYVAPVATIVDMIPRTICLFGHLNMPFSEFTIYSRS